MREWSLTGDDPYSLFLCADARLCVPTYVDDQIWEISLHGNDPPAVGLETTYGLRVQGMRIFPSFFTQGSVVSDPRSFAEPVLIRRFLVNYVRLECKPTAAWWVELEYWVPDSQRIAGRFTLQNQSRTEQEMRLRLQAVLRAHPYDTEDSGASGHGRVATGGMRPESISGVTVLTGVTEDLAPVVFLAGGARPEVGPYPALGVDLRLSPGESRSLVWAHAGLADIEGSFASARELAGCSWDAEVARVEMVNASIVDIKTGDPDWDAAFAAAQNVSLGAYIGPTRFMAYPSFVEARVPDRGFSTRQDGRDYSWHWAGQAAGQARINLPQILPAAPRLAEGVLQNFIKSQKQDGSIDWKPGLGGQRNGSLCAPLLADLTWQIYQQTQDSSLLEQVLQPLLAFFDRWFASDHDRDRDGLPEWDNTMQAGYDDWPTFVRWRTWGQGLDITKAETPDLAAYLSAECRALVQIANELGRGEIVAPLESRLEQLKQAVDRTWSEVDASYHHQDRDLHQAVSGEILGRGRGEFVMHVDRAFEPAARLLIRVGASEGVSHAIQVLIHGRDPHGGERTERLTERSFQWFWDYGTATSDQTHVYIERIEVRGLNPEFETELRTADFTRQDQSLLLPLWAGIPQPARAERLVQQTLLDEDRYWRRFGVPMCSTADPAFDATEKAGSGGVRMLWNVMIAEGLLKYGYTAQAADLFSRLMQACIHSLRSDKSFHDSYNPDAPQGLGERNHISGVAPLSLFLKILGVQLVTPRKVLLRGANPFEWPVEVSWMGLRVLRETDRTHITFPDGQSVVVEGDAPRLVEQAQEPGVSVL
jgi:hypothetical protein